jgi:hypothetical protein
MQRMIHWLVRVVGVAAIAGPPRSFNTGVNLEYGSKHIGT